MEKKREGGLKLGHGTLGSFQIPLLVATGLIAILVIHERPLLYGMLVAAFGEAIQVWSASHLWKNKAVITSGPYAHVRNPMYIGRFFVGLGVTLMTHNLWIVAAYALLFVIYVKLRVGGEEARLAGIFGNEYLEYCKEVPRFLPRLTPYPKSARAKAQWESFVRNHEYRPVIGLIFMFAVVCARVHYYGHLTIGDILRYLLRLF